MPILPPATPEQSESLLRTATSVSRLIASIPSIDELLPRLVSLLCTDQRYPFAGIFLTDSAGQWADLAAACSPGKLDLPPDFKLSTGGNSLVGMAARLRQPRFVVDIDQEEGFLRNLQLHLPEARGEAALPLIVADQVVGVLNIQMDRQQVFSQEVLDTLQAVSAQLAVAVHHASLQRQNQELLQRSERRLRLFEAASQVARQVTSILTLDELLPKTVDIICSAYGFYYAGVFLLDDRGEWAVLRAGHGEPGRILLSQHHRLAVGGPSMVGMATALGEARIALDVGDERVHFKNPVLPFTRSEMALPLRIGAGNYTRILGAVTIQSIEERAFSSEDILTLQTMVDQLAVAINNARLLYELGQANRELLRTKTYEALTAASTAAIHWIGNKALPITTTTARLQADLAAGELDKASMQEDLEMIAQNASLIVAVKENLLGPAREQLPRPALLSDVAKAAAHLAGVSPEMLTVAAVQDEPLALADTAELSRLLGNLYRNSTEALSHHIYVQVAPAAGDMVSLRITDDGKGIEPEMLTQMWAPFVTTKGPGASGLGLPAAQHIAAQLQGSISASSQPGHGATFEVLLPASLASEPAPLPVTPAPSVLLVDDDDAWARFAQGVFAAAGVPCQRVADLTDVDFAVPDLVLVDEDLGGAALPDVLASLQAASAAGKALLLTPSPSAERLAAQLKTGLKDVALKPYTAEGLLELL